MQMQKFAEAKPYCQRSIVIFQKTVGPTHAFYSLAALNYAAVLENTGEPGKAAELKKLVEQLQRAKETPQKPKAK